MATPPTIDGALSPGEWAAAAAIDLWAIPGNELPASLLVANDGTFLYVAYDAVGDTVEDGSDGASVAFDTDHDGASTPFREDQFFWGPAAPAAESHWKFDGFSWSLEDAPFDTGLPGHAGLASGYGFGPSDLSGADHRTYELRIPLALLGVAPGGVIGFLGGSEVSPGVVDGRVSAYST